MKTKLFVLRNYEKGVHDTETIGIALALWASRNYSNIMCQIDTSI